MRKLTKTGRAPVRWVRWVAFGFLIGLSIGLTLPLQGCASAPRPAPASFEGQTQLIQEIAARLQGTYYNPEVHTLSIHQGQPPEVRMVGQHLQVVVDGSHQQLNWATNEIVRLIQLHTPEDQWGKLDVGLFYDRAWR